ncbi:unnamed protein product [Arctogadus glacialis]
MAMLSEFDRLLPDQDNLEQAWRGGPGGEGTWSRPGEAAQGEREPAVLSQGFVARASNRAACCEYSGTVTVSRRCDWVRTQLK